VTGAEHASTIVTGATLADGRQILVALPTSLPGVTIPQPASLVGLSASDTGPVQLDNVRIGRELLLAGPAHDVMAQGVGARTGGLETSTLAVGLAAGAIEYLEAEAAKRDELIPPTNSLRAELDAIRDDLLSLAAGEAACSTEQLRQRANSIVLRAAQAALTAAKGSGYVIGHPAGRWCREALFFLVWSCPQPVAAAHLCELAGIRD
jgi:alkylation response protein AidB-like acyl-CoA dehydrogenase